MAQSHREASRGGLSLAPPQKKLFTHKQATKGQRATKQQESCSIVQWPSLTEKRRGGSSSSPSNSKAFSLRSRPRRPDLPKIRIPSTCRPETGSGNTAASTA